MLSTSHLEWCATASKRRNVGSSSLPRTIGNLAVLGDAELVIPFYAEEAKGVVRDPGAVDHPDTLRHVCQLLEGGAAA